MAIIKTTAIVLKCDNYRETSKIVTLYSLTHGKIRCMAKGVRKPNTRWGGNLQTLAYLNIMFYYKDNRGLNLITGAEYAEQLKNIHTDNDKLKIGFRIVELVNKTTIDYHDNGAIFELLRESLQNLNSATKNYENLLFKFEFMLAKLLGFGIDFKKDNMYRTAELSAEDYISPGETLRDSRMSYNKTEDKFYDVLMDGNFADIMEFNILTAFSKKMDSYFELYFREHIENIGILKTRKILNS
ncbi:MAG: DNA repair protein RecO [Ignavibacteria bacterium]